MNYTAFKNKFKDSFLDYMPQKYQALGVSIAKVSKVNQTLDGFTLIFPDDSNYASPLIYLNQIYDDYLENKDFETVMRKSANAMSSALDNYAIEIKNKSKELLNINYFRENVVCQLINATDNQELLNELPHIATCDLAMICRIILHCNNNSLSAVMVNHNIIEHLGITEDELFKIANRNTLRLFPPKLRKLSEVLENMLTTQNDLHSEDICSAIKANDLDNTIQMYVLGSSTGSFGACYMTCSEILQPLADKLNSNLFILPSSIHEVILISESFCDANHLSECVKFVNDNHVPIDEKLSDSVYFYDRISKEISIASSLSTQKQS